MADPKHSLEKLADDIIADCDDNPRTAVIALMKINMALSAELRELTGKRAYERQRYQQIGSGC